MRQEMTVKQKSLFDMTQPLDDSGCWIWQGQISNSGYGRTMVRDTDNTVKMISAQSASYQQFIAEVPAGYLVKQSCGNRLCINPQHLELMKV
jgi:hypothetical protein